MSINTLFKEATEIFIGDYLITTVNIWNLKNRVSIIKSPGIYIFDLNKYKINNQLFIALELVNLNKLTDGYYGIQNSPYISAYWVPQGMSCEIPVEPDDSSPKFVFTPDFSGCSLVIDQISNNKYRVYHITKGRCCDEYLRNNIDHGHGIAGWITPDVYRNDTSFIFLKYNYNINRWEIFYQRQLQLIGHTTSNKLGLTTDLPLQIKGSGKIPVFDLTKGEGPPPSLTIDGISISPSDPSSASINC